MRDLREVAELKEHWKFLGPLWRETPFVWKRWDRFSEHWTHDHCEFCFACICNRRDRFPNIDLGERGCYRHAYYAEQLNQESNEIYIWVCRTCFKRVHAEFGWRVGGQG